MRALDFLGAAFADGVLLRIKMTGVRTPLIGIVVRQAERLQQRLELEENFILTAAKDLRPPLAGLMINRMPEPTGVGFAADKRPHFGHLSLASALDVYGDL